MYFRSSPVNGFSFHCWFRLDSFSGISSERNEDGSPKELYRRQLYSFYTESGSGFEAFITPKSILTVAVANKKEFLAVPLEDFPLRDEKWHSLQVIHLTAKRPFGSSQLQVWLDGTKRMDCSLKYMEKSEPFSYCQIGSPLCRGSIPALHDGIGKDGGALARKSSIKEGIRDAIKIGLPGVFYLPQTLTGKKEENDPHIRWTLIGLEDQLWGKAIALVGQIGMICCFKDALSPTDTAMLHALGPNRGLAFPQGEDHQEVIDFMNKIVFFYSASAIHANSNVCPNLKTSVSGGSTYEAQVFTTSHSVRDVKDVINCIGGVQILFPLLEQAASRPKEHSDETCIPNVGYLSLQSQDDSVTADDTVNNDGTNDWEVLPSSSFADWKLEQNPISGFLTLVKNLVAHHTINTEQLMRGGGIPIIGVLLQKANPSLIDVNVLMAAQLMVEMATSMNKDQRLLSQIYHSILFDFRIWSKSEFHVQIGHIQYLSTLIKEDRKYFRRRFGVQFFLDLIRQHYSSCSSVLSEDDEKTIRMSLFGLIKFFLQKDITAKEVIPLNSFMLAIHDSVLLTEVIDVIAHYLMSKMAKDQMFLVMHETRRADLLYCLILDEELCQPKTKLVLPMDEGLETTWPAYDARIHGEMDPPQLIQVIDEENYSNLRIHILHLISILLRTNKVSSRHKTRMNLQDSKGYLGLLHLRFKLISSNATQPITLEEVCSIFDQMILFDDPTTYQGILGLVHHLQWSSLDIKLEMARRLMSFMFSKPEIPSHFAKQIGWQDCLARLLVKRMVKPELEQSIVSIDQDVMSFDENISFLDHEFSPTHLVEQAARSSGLSEETVGRMGDVATNATKAVNATKTIAKEKVSDTVLKTQGLVSHAQDKLFANRITDKVYSTIDMVNSNIESIKKGASGARSGSHTPVDNVKSSFDTVSMNSETQSVDIHRGGLEQTPRASTPNFMLENSSLNRFEIFDVGGEIDTDTYCFLQRSELKSTASAASSEDVSMRGDIDSQKSMKADRLKSTSPTPSTSTMTSEVAPNFSELEGLRYTDAALQARKSKKNTDESIHQQEEELCQLVVNILFTIMWRGKPGFPSEDVIKERGQVIACINMLGLNNELYRSHVDLKRRIVELCVQAVLADLRGNEHGVATNSASAEHVMQWAYDLIVLDTYGNFGKKVTESLLDGILGLLECLMVFQEGRGQQSQKTEQQEVEWEAMGKMAFDILLKCAENNSNEFELCAMATAKLHSLVQTRSSSSVEENGYLIYRISQIISGTLKSEESEEDTEAENKEHFSFLAPIMKALLEKAKAQLTLTTQLPSLNLQSQMSGPSFFEHFQAYQSGEEWKYFIEKKAKPLYDSYKLGMLTKLPHDMDVFWAECYETSKIASHKRSREVGESKLRFQSRYIEPYYAGVKAENARFNNVLSQQKSHFLFIQKRWTISKRLFFGPRGVWGIKDNSYFNETTTRNFWKIASNENFLRMRMKLMPNLSFNAHLEASAQRDNTAVDAGGQGQTGAKEGDRKRKDSVDVSHESNKRQGVLRGNSVKEISKKLLQWQVSKEPTQDAVIEDSLTEEDMKSIAMEQMETLTEGGGNTDNKGSKVKSSERLLYSTDCQLVTFMSVIKGKFELTTSYVYFFDTSPYNKGDNETVDDGERKDFRWSLSQLREMHLRRFNLRRSGIEFFLLDQTNYFLNFESNRKRNKVYSKIVSLKLPNMIYSSSRSPADLLKASGLTQKWVTRQITNFEYLMQLNTISGRTFNDLSQYPIFPWILADYTSHQLNLADPAAFRDLTKPMGIQNPKHVKEVKERYDNFEDPSGTVAKFHYGTHYSNSAMVLHYLVRVEPFASLHIQLQSGRWDVADRQFHSVSQSWKSLYENLNDVKELIPEFFYFPEFLLNLNNFDLGQLQGGKKKRVNNIELPRWSTNAYDFIRKHREALESDFVSSQLHHWIDLIFGYKQKGQAAVDALNVFYYCTYEGAVDLDAIKDESEREAVEGMINNFGQTPCQLLKDPHPSRLPISDCLSKPNSKIKPNLLQLAPDWKPYLIDMGLSEKDPVVHINLPKFQTRSNFIQFGGGSGSDTLVTVSSRAVVGTHGWSLSNIGGIKESDFAFEVDPSFSSPNSSISESGQAQTTSIGSPRNATSGSKRRIPGTFTGIVPEWPLSGKLFVVSHDAKYIFSGGHWDNSLQTYSISKTKTVSIVIRHIDTITCLSLDATGNYIMSGSKDTTSIVWEIYPGHSPTMVTLHSTGPNPSNSVSGSGGVDGPNPRPIQVLSGHDKAISCVALSTELDMAVSGSEDGTLNVYTIKEGQYIRTIVPIQTIGQSLTESRSKDVRKGTAEDYGRGQPIKDFTVAQLQLSYQGHVVFSGHGKQVHSIHTFSINGHHLHSSPVGHRITSLIVEDDYIFCGDENGDLVLKDLFTGDVIHSLPLHLPIQCVMMVPEKSHALVPLRDGKLVVVGTFHTSKKS